MPPPVSTHPLSNTRPSDSINTHSLAPSSDTHSSLSSSRTRSARLYASTHGHDTLTSLREHSAEALLHAGAGKTTLLNALCGRATYGTVEGEILENGVPLVPAGVMTLSVATHCHQLPLIVSHSTTRRHPLPLIVSHSTTRRHPLPLIVSNSVTHWHPLPPASD